MITTIRRRLAIAILCVPASAGADPMRVDEPSPYALQIPGDFHGGEAVARDGQRWLALRLDADGRARLDATRLRVFAVEDPLGDAPGEKTGQRVESDGDEALAFLRGPALRAGPILRADVETRSVDGLPGYRIAFEGAHYTIRTACPELARISADGTLSDGTPAQCRVVLDRDAASATLLTLAAYRARSGETDVVGLGDDASPTLMFAGDIDRDGKLDLIFDTSDHYNLLRPTLFLSRPADAAPANTALPLRAVATYSAVGC